MTRGLATRAITIQLIRPTSKLVATCANFVIIVGYKCYKLCNSNQILHCRLN